MITLLLQRQVVYSTFDERLSKWNRPFWTVVSKKIIIFGSGHLRVTLREQSNDKGLHGKSFNKSVYSHTALVYGLGHFYEQKYDAVLRMLFWMKLCMMCKTDGDYEN